MGVTKRVAELYMRSKAQGSPGAKLISVRFGNVLGTRGSVVPIFKKQIERGGPVTVSDSEATRFFMTVREATMLVIQAGVLGSGGETFILDMGEAVSILELARQMITLSGYLPEDEIPIQFTGLKSGEKLDEKLDAPGEKVVETDFKKLLVVQPEGRPSPVMLDQVDELIDLACKRDRKSVVEKLRQLVPEYAPPEGSRWAG
jgi:FlaA1/EpsC-like NDP-sugar epimerase